MKKTQTLLLLTSLLLASCGPSGTPLPGELPPVTVTTTRVSVSVRIPSAPTPQGVTPQYVPNTTTQLRIRIGGTDQTLPVTPGSSNCVTGTDGTTCTFTLSLNVAAGNGLTLVVDALDSSLTVLSTASKTVDVQLGQDNPLSITLVGVAAGASYAFTDRAGDVTAGTTTDLDRGGVYAVGVGLSDPSGQIIVDPGRPDDLLCSSNPDFTVTAGGIKGRFTVTAPEPTGQDQITTLSVVVGADCATGAALASGTVRVPAETLVLDLSTASPVAGSSVLATATLKTARGNPLPLSGRAVAFTTTNGSVPSPVQTGAAGTATSTVTTSPTIGAGTVTATADGVSQSASFTSVAGTPTQVTSSMVFSPDSVKVGAQSTLTVTVKDANGNPVTTAPTVTAPAGAVVTSTGATGNVFTYAVTAPSTPGTSRFSASVNGTVVGQADLVTTAYPLVVLNGAVPLTAGSRYDFTSSAARTFTVQEANYSGAFTVTSSNVAVASASISGGTLTVTPGSGVGISTITVTDANAQSFAFDVSVTAVTLVIN